MKTLIALTTAMALAASVFAMKIPTGDNVRVADIKQNGDGATVEVTLGGENTGITTPVGAVQAKASSVVYFYDKGALKELTAVEQDVTTPIGTLKVKDGGRVTFYENGALATLSTADQTVDLPPLKGVRVADSEVMSFYESGKIKRVYIRGNEALQTPIGVIDTRRGSGSYIEYYESGSPYEIYLPNDPVLTINGTVYGTLGCYYSTPYPISLYDSGSSDKWLVKSFVTREYEKDGAQIKSVACDSKIGKLDVALNPGFTGRHDSVTLDKNGNILSAPLYKSPDFTVKVNGEEAYIKGGEYKKVKWLGEYRDSSDTFRTISFYDDAATIKSFFLDDLVMTEMDGIKLKMPAGTEVSLWENGSIRQCTFNSKTTVNVKGIDYEIKEGNSCLFHRNGTLHAIEADYNFFIDTFYPDGNKKRMVYYGKIHADEKDRCYVMQYFSPNGSVIDTNFDNVVVHSTRQKFNFQKGDSGRNICMVFFDDNDNPSSYTMLKLDKDGNYILDDEGVPIEDPKKKKFIKG